MTKPVPAHLQKVINEIFRAEGGFNPVDRDQLPCLKGITAVVWAEWVNSHPELNKSGAKLTKEMAADDIRAIAGKGGKAYTNLSEGDFTKQASLITHETFFTKPGFDKINSPAIQQYVMEISFHRGPESAKWAINYATGVEPRHADPLLHGKLDKSPERKDAVDFANGFLTTGENKTKGSNTNPKVNDEAESRLYGRLRVAKLIEESHFVGDRNMGSKALGLFRRALEFDWAKGNEDASGLTASKDPYFLKIYQNFKKSYDTFEAKPTKAAKEIFTNEVTTLSKNLLSDPNSPKNAASDVAPKTPTHSAATVHKPPISKLEATSVHKPATESSKKDAHLFEILIQAHTPKGKDEAGFNRLVDDLTKSPQNTPQRFPVQTNATNGQPSGTPQPLPLGQKPLTR